MSFGRVFNGGAAVLYGISKNCVDACILLAERVQQAQNIFEKRRRATDRADGFVWCALFCFALKLQSKERAL